MSAWSADVFHTFWPLTTHSSPSRTAVAWRPARSEPAPGSLNSWHHVSSPVSVRRRYVVLQRRRRMVVDRRRRQSGAHAERCGNATDTSDRLVGDPIRPGRHPLPEPLLRPRRDRPPGIDEPLAPFEQREVRVPGGVEPREHVSLDRHLGDPHVGTLSHSSAGCGAEHRAQTGTVHDRSAASTHRNEPPAQSTSRRAPR